MQDMFYIIVGASRGLGASLVNSCLKNGLRVVGIGRTSENAINDILTWRQTGRFKYIQADIGESSSVNIMRSIIGMCEDKPVCVIFNAAVIDSDVGNDGKLMFDIFTKVNRTGIDGFVHTLEVFEDYLISCGGMLVGISSISAWLPPSKGNKVAYPASKAYLDMALRSLRLLWHKRVHLMTVHLGHMSGDGSWFVPRYDRVADKIIKATLLRMPPESICISVLYCIAYGILRRMPDRFVSNMVELIRGLSK